MKYELKIDKDLVVSYMETVALSRFFSDGRNQGFPWSSPISSSLSKESGLLTVRQRLNPSNTASWEEQWTSFVRCVIASSMAFSSRNALEESLGVQGMPPPDSKVNKACYKPTTARAVAQAFISCWEATFTGSMAPVDADSLALRFEGKGLGGKPFAEVLASLPVCLVDEVLKKISARSKFLGLATGLVSNVNIFTRDLDKIEAVKDVMATIICNPDSYAFRYGNGAGIQVSLSSSASGEPGDTRSPEEKLLFDTEMNFIAAYNSYRRNRNGVSLNLGHGGLGNVLVSTSLRVALPDVVSSLPPGISLGSLAALVRALRNDQELEAYLHAVRESYSKWLPLVSDGEDGNVVSVSDKSVILNSLLEDPDSWLLVSDNEESFLSKAARLALESGLSKGVLKEMFSRAIDRATSVKE